jgi:hypothetical protein
MYSVVVNDKVLDYKYVKRETDTVFYIGDICLGTIHKYKKKWFAIPIEKKEFVLRQQYGFCTRYDASEYLIDYAGYYKGEVSKKDRAHMEKLLERLFSN